MDQWMQAVGQCLQVQSGVLAALQASNDALVAALQQQLLINATLTARIAALEEQAAAPLAQALQAAQARHGVQA